MVERKRFLKGNAPMLAEQWLLLTDYSSKYRISVSTLRRRIKNGDIQFRFDGGKYFIFDAPPSAQETQPVYSETLTFPGIQTTSRHAVSSIDPQPPVNTFSFKAYEERVKSAPSPVVVPIPEEEPILSSASQLLTELKRAYMSILQEREEQLIQLKEEVSDLKTLVRVLEDDNERMRKILSSQMRA